MNSIYKKNISIGININNENTEIKNISLKGKYKSNSKLPISNKPEKNKTFHDKSKNSSTKKNSLHQTNNQSSKNINKNNNKVHYNSNSNKLNQKNLLVNRFNENYMKNLKFIQLWWKTIFQIIKIQKNIRGFLFRLKLIIYLDESENLFKSLLNFILQIKKSICRNVFFVLVKNINKESTIEISKFKKLVNKSNKYNIQKIKKVVIKK